MGTVVAMMMSKIRALVGGLFCLVALTACSSDPTGTSPNQLMYDVFSKGVKAPADGSASKDISQLTRAAISEVDFPLILITIPETEAASTITITALKGDIVTWVSVDRVGVIFDGPVLFGTRGIGPDLLTAEAAPLRALLSSGKSGSITRAYRHLNGLDQIDTLTFQCEVSPAGSETIVVLERSHATRKVQENCVSADGFAIENVYWLGSDNTLWKSKQWVSLQTGYMITERLVK